MLSRILWISAAAIALVAGMVVQDGDSIFRWHDKAHSLKSEHAEHRMDRAIDRSFEKMQVTGPDGREVEVPAETKRELANAVGRLVKAETDLALLRIDDGSDKEIEAARDRIADARADIDRLKARIKGAERAARVEPEALREQISREVREDVRASVRDAVGS
jgi:uncharacterized membrane protein YccC